MTPTMKELGQRAVASKAWPGYLPGMHDTDGLRVLTVYDDGIGFCVSCGSMVFDTAAVSDPDFSDRATLALLRDIVASAYGGTQVTVEPPRGACRTYYVTVYNWRLIKVWQGVMSVHNYGDPELGLIEALVCALENAPASSSRQSDDA